MIAFTRILKTVTLSGLLFFIFSPGFIYAHNKVVVARAGRSQFYSTNQGKDGIPCPQGYIPVSKHQVLKRNPAFLQSMESGRLWPLLPAKTGIVHSDFSERSGSAGTGCPVPSHFNYDSIKCEYGSVIATLDQYNAMYPERKVYDTIRDVAGCDSIITTIYITTSPTYSLIFDTDRVIHVCYGYPYWDYSKDFFKPLFFVTRDTIVKDDTGELQTRCGGGLRVVTYTRFVVNRPYPVIQNIDTVICYNSFLSGILITADTNIQQKTLYSSGCDSSIVNYRVHIVKPGRKVISFDTTMCDGAKYDSLLIHDDTLLVDSTEEHTFCGKAITVYNTYIHVLKGITFSLGRDTTICDGNFIVLSAPDSAVGYLWNTGGTAHAITVNKSGTYSVQVRSDNGCTTTDSMHVTFVNDPPFTTPADMTICKGDNIQLPVHGGKTYHWSPSSSLSCTACDAPIAYPDSSVQYNVTIEGWCHTEQHIINLTVDDPELRVSDSSVIIYKGQQVKLAVEASGQISWSPFINLSCSACQSPIASPNTTTVYTVTAMEGKCVEKRVVTVKVLDGLYLFIPSAFSPNGDGVNDIFKPFTNLPGDYEIWLFNRWGKLIFHTTELTKGWDGTYRNMPQPIGGYPYLVKFRDMNNHIEIRRGSVTLVR